MLPNELTVLVFAPTGRDAALAVKLLGQAGLKSQACADMTAMCLGIREGVGALLVAEEALSPEALQRLTEALDAQESWSDVPVLVFPSANPTAAATRRMERILGSVANATFIERPVRQITLITALKSALRARERQYQVRGILAAQARRESEARGAVRFLQQLLGIVSHDLRNPISAVLISAESLLRRDQLSDKQQRTLRRIMDAGQRANAMVLDLLDFTRARLGRGMPLQVVDCDLGQLARQLTDEMVAAHPDREIILDTAGDVRGQWDQGRIAQVLQNLVGNALQYSNPDAPVHIRLRLFGTDRVILSVQNVGTQIAPDQRDRIFEPMERGEGRDVPTPEGDSRSIGLGLYIVKQIVVAHGGTISLRSGTSTTFEVCLPRFVPRNGNQRLSV